MNVTRRIFFQLIECGFRSHLYRQARRPEEMRAMIMKARRAG